MRRHSRPAYTLLEVLLALAICTLLLVAVYAAIGYQLGYANVGRTRVEEAALSRALFNRMDNDIKACLALSEPNRFRKQSADADALLSALAGGGSTTPATSPTTTTSKTSTTTTTSKTSTTTTTTSGMSTTGTSTTDSASNDNSSTGGTGPLTLPMGVQGDATTLTLIITKAPVEAFGGGDGQMVTSDIRKVTYWLGENGGLCRHEVKVINSQDVGDSRPEGADEEKCMLAPEVKSLEIKYFDGTAWQDSWNCDESGEDGATPIGSPRAIAIVIGIPRPGRTGDDPDDLRYYRHVIAISTANGNTIQTTDAEGEVKP